MPERRSAREQLAQELAVPDPGTVPPCRERLLAPFPGHLVLHLVFLLSTVLFTSEGSWSNFVGRVGRPSMYSLQCNRVGPSNRHPCPRLQHHSTCTEQVTQQDKPLTGCDPLHAVCLAEVAVSWELPMLHKWAWGPVEEEWLLNAYLAMPRAGVLFTDQKGGGLGNRWALLVCSESKGR